MKPELPIKKYGAKRENVTRENHLRFTLHASQSWEISF
jgi:hypothetical protein